MKNLTKYENVIRQIIYAAKMINNMLSQVKEIEGVQVVQNESIICENKEQHKKVKEILSNFSKSKTNLESKLKEEGLL